jgi:glutathione S-transferase
MKEPVRIVGNYLSPYVRKVLVVLDQKNIPYEIDPIIPAFGDERFTAVSPLRLIPVLIDEQATLCDSSVICQYLEERYPEPALYPQDLVLRARARWLEEFADTQLGDAFIWHLFYQVTILPSVFGQATNQEIVQRALTSEIPQLLDYLETQIPTEGFLCGALSIADISIACFFRTACFARYRVDAARWPKSAAFVKRMFAHPSFAKLAVFEDRLMRTHPAQQRTVLGELGAPLTRDTFATPMPQRRIRET